MDKPSVYLYLDGDGLVTVSSSRIKDRKHIEDFPHENLFGVHLFGVNAFGKVPPSRKVCFHPERGAVEILPFAKPDAAAKWVQLRVGKYFLYVVASKEIQNTTQICFSIQMGTKSKHKEVERSIGEAMRQAEAVEVFQHLPIPPYRLANDYTWDAFVFLPDAYPQRFMQLVVWIDWLARNRSLNQVRVMLGLEEEEEKIQGDRFLYF